MIHVRTLGTSRIDSGSLQVKPTSVRKFAMLLHLAAERGRAVSRATLHELIFPDQPARNAQHSLREMTYQFRQVGIPLASDTAGVELPAEAVQCDYVDLIQQERPDATRLKAAEGGFLPGYAPNHSEAFSEWYDGYRARSVFDICKALLREAHRARSVADWGTTERASRACLALDPLNEEATLALAEMLALGGAKAQAVKLLDDYVRDVGWANDELRVPANILRRRLAERVPDGYRAEGTTTFVGREQEMLLASECLERAKAGSRQCLIIGGEPGIGKSRLASELYSLALLSGAQTRRVTMQPHDARRPLSVFAELVPQLLEMRGAIGCSPQSLELLKRLTNQGSDLEPHSSRPEELSFISSALTTAIHDLITAVASENSLSFFIDDAHCIDPISRRTLLDVASIADSARLLVVLVTRDHRRVAEGCSAANRLRVLALKRMGDNDVGVVVDELLVQRRRPVTEALRADIVARAAGNPMYAILSVGDVSVTPKPALTDTLVDLLARRLAVLTDRAQSVLIACVALGRYCSIPRLDAMLEMPHADFIEALTRLTDEGLLVSSDDTVVAGHPLIAEVLTGRLERAVVRAVFHRAAEILEIEARASRSTSLYWESADRWLVATNHAKAFSALRECAKHALALGQGCDAVDTLRRACDLSVPHDQLCEALRELVLAADIAGDPATVVSAAERGYALGVPRHHDDVEHAVARATLITCDAASPAAERLVACMKATDSSTHHRMWAATALVKIAHVIGRPDLVQIARQTMDRERTRQAPSIPILEFDLIYASVTHDFDRVLEVARTILSMCKSLSNLASLSPQLNVGIALWFAGDFEGATRVHLSAFEVAMAIRATGYQLRLATMLTSNYFDLGDEQAGNSWLARARALRPQLSTARPAFNFQTLELELAICLSELPRARLIFKELVDEGAFEGSWQRERWGEAARLLIAVAGGDATPDDEGAARALIATAGCATPNNDDFEIAAACEALRDLGKADEARRIMSAYVNHERKWRSPHSGALRLAANRLGVAAQTPNDGASV